MTNELQTSGRQDKQQLQGRASELDASRIEASLKDGVLKLSIPKLQEAKPRRVEVRVG